MNTEPALINLIDVAAAFTAEFGEKVEVTTAHGIPLLCLSNGQVLGGGPVDARHALTLTLLRRRFPALGLSFGYIGNVERWGDDRSFYVFSNFDLGKGNYCQVSLGGAEDLSKNYTFAKVSRAIIRQMCAYESRLVELEAFAVEHGRRSK